jgi:hypothetical protein
MDALRAAISEPMVMPVQEAWVQGVEWLGLGMIRETLNG